MKHPRPELDVAALRRAYLDAARPTLGLLAYWLFRAIAEVTRRRPTPKT